MHEKITMLREIVSVILFVQIKKHRGRKQFTLENQARPHRGGSRWLTFRKVKRSMLRKNK